MKKIVLLIFLIFNVDISIYSLIVTIHNPTESMFYLDIVEPVSLNMGRPTVNNDGFQIDVSINRNSYTYTAEESLFYNPAPSFYAIKGHSKFEKLLEDNKNYVFIISYLAKADQDRHQFKTTFILLTKENISDFKRYCGYGERDLFNPLIFNICPDILGLSLLARDYLGGINHNYKWLQHKVVLTIND